ncbi:MAG: DUF6754 domain-containing protein [Anaerolineales bacterium]
MNALADLSSVAGCLWLVALALYALATWLLDMRLSRRQRPLRTITVYERLAGLVSRSVETDAAVHLSLGSGSLLTEAPQVASACALGQRLMEGALPRALCTCGSPTLYVAAAGALQGAAIGHGGEQQTARERPSVCLVGTEAAALAPGAWDAADGRQLAGEVFFGPFGAEGLLLAEGSPTVSPERLVGTAEIDALVGLSLGASAWVVGEDVYAARAYAHKDGQQGGLALQDAIRVVLLLAVLAGLGLRLAGWGG